MRVYIELDGKEYENDFEPLETLAATGLYHILMHHKYKVMWKLRSIENEIDETQGVIIITSQGIKTKSFTREMTDKITTLIKASD